jgi:hypothetical protein
VLVTLGASVAPRAGAGESISFSIKEARTYAYKVSLIKEIIENAPKCNPDDDPKYKCDEGQYNHELNCPDDIAIGPRGKLPEAKPPEGVTPVEGGAGDGTGGDRPPTSSPVRLNELVSVGAASHFGPVKEAAGFASKAYVDLSGRDDPEQHTESEILSTNKADYEERCWPEDAAKDGNDYVHLLSHSFKDVETYHYAECFRQGCQWGGLGNFGADAERARSITHLYEEAGRIHMVLSAKIEDLSYGSGALTVDAIETFVDVSSDGTASGLKWSVSSTASGAELGGQPIALPPGQVVSGPGFSFGMAAPYVGTEDDGSQIRVEAPGFMIATTEQTVHFAGAESGAGLGEELDYRFQRNPGPDTSSSAGDGTDDFSSSAAPFDSGAAVLGGTTFGGGVAIGPSDTADPQAAAPATEMLIYEQATGRGAVAGIVALGVLGWFLLLGRWLQRFGWGKKLYRLQPFRTVDWLYRAFVKS